MLPADKDKGEVVRSMPVRLPEQLQILLQALVAVALSQISLCGCFRKGSISPGLVSHEALSEATGFRFAHECGHIGEDGVVP